MISLVCDETGYFIGQLKIFEYLKAQLLVGLTAGPF